MKLTIDNMQYEIIGNDIGSAFSFIKQKRNEKLQTSDWTQMPDVVLSNKEEWATYRQELRDYVDTNRAAIEQQYFAGDINITFPAQPINTATEEVVQPTPTQV